MRITDLNGATTWCNITPHRSWCLYQEPPKVAILSVGGGIEKRLGIFFHRPWTVSLMNVQFHSILTYLGWTHPCPQLKNTFLQCSLNVLIELLSQLRGIFPFKIKSLFDTWFSLKNEPFLVVLLLQLIISKFIGS